MRAACFWPSPASAHGMLSTPRHSGRLLSGCSPHWSCLRCSSRAVRRRSGTGTIPGGAWTGTLGGRSGRGRAFAPPTFRPKRICPEGNIRRGIKKGCNRPPFNPREKPIWLPFCKRSCVCHHSTSGAALNMAVWKDQASTILLTPPLRRIQSAGHLCLFGHLMW